MEHALHFTEPLVRRAVLRYCARSVGWVYPLVLLGLAFFLATRLLDGDRSWVVGVSGSIVVLALLCPIVLFRNQWAAALFKLRALRGEAVIFRADADSFTVRSAAGASELPWRAIIEVWRYPDFWLLLFSKAHFMTFPLDGVAPDTQSFVLDRVRESGGRIA